MASMTAERRAQLDAFTALKIKHPRLDEIDQALMRAIHGYRSYTLLAVYGPSGVGKSTVMHHVASRCRAAESDTAVVPVVIVRASPEDIGASARLDYYRQLLAQLRGHVAINDRVRQLALATHPEKKRQDPAEWLDMRDAVEYALALLRVKVVFVDEAQHLMAVDTPHRPAAQLDWLKALTNRTNVLHVLIGNFDLYDCCHLNGQAARRMRDLHFPRYHLDQRTECEEFVAALRTFLERVPLFVDIPGLLAHWRWFGEWSLGCIGVLGDWLVETVDALCQEGATTLTIEALTRHALQPDQRLRMEMEARTGEFKVEQAKARSAHELQQLLGAMMAADGADARTDGHESTPAGASVDQGKGPRSRSRSRSRIERAATRDPIGDLAGAERTRTCTFAEVVNIAPNRFLDSGVTRVECPLCHAVRQVRVRHAALRFPTHDQRKTRTAQTRRRWAKQDTTREVVGV
jgi:hypothetical protein